MVIFTDRRLLLALAQKKAIVAVDKLDFNIVG
jgi:hypothetical protein